MATRGSENRFPGVTLVGQASDPTTPSSGDFRLFVADDGTFYLMDDTGAKLDLTPSSGLTDPMTSRGDIIVRNASNVTARLAKGSADTYLGSDGTDVGYSAVTDAKLSTSDITTNNASTSKHGFLKKLSNSATDYMDGTGAWSTPSGGGSGGALVYITKQTASSSSTVDFTSFIDSAYHSYRIYIIGATPGTDNTDLLMRYGTGGSPTWDSGSNYNYLGYYDGHGDAFTRRSATGASSFQMQGSVGTTTDRSMNSIIDLFNLSGSHSKYFKSDGVHAITGGNFYHWQQRGIYVSNTAVTGVRFLMSSGNIATGDFYLYGIKNS